MFFMENLKSFIVTLQNFRNSQYEPKIEVFVNELGKTCLQVPQEELVHYRGKVAKAGYSFSHPPFEASVITLDQSVENIESVKLLLKKLDIRFKKITDKKKLEVFNVS
jgi:hypothetical protein